MLVGESSLCHVLITTLVLFALWIGVNVLDIVWIWNYVRATTTVNPHNAANRNNSSWVGFYIMST